jgi:Vacuolar import and degradation protein
MPVTEINHQEDPKVSNTEWNLLSLTTSDDSLESRNQSADEISVDGVEDVSEKNNEMNGVCPITFSEQEPKSDTVNRDDTSQADFLLTNTSASHRIHFRKAAPRSPISNNYSLDYSQSRHIHKRSNQLPRLLNKYLRPNAQYTGEQQSGKSRYTIKVNFKTVDLINSVVTGFLQISGLTEHHPEITTCFKGEIINNPLNKFNWEAPNKRSQNDVRIKSYSFVTENKLWGSFLKNDLEHWKKLTNSSHLNENQLKQRLASIQNGVADNQFVYMRWKEEFLLPDSRVKQINGASFEGFYYIVLNMGGFETPSLTPSSYSSAINPGTIGGLYYHKSSEKFQSLNLRYVEVHGISNTFEFT